MEKPDVDFIEGLSPPSPSNSAARRPIRVPSSPPTTEIYDYLRLLFANIGQPHCPVSGQPITRQTTSDIVDKILGLPAKTRIVLLAPVVVQQKGEFRDVIGAVAARVSCGRASMAKRWS